MSPSPVPSIARRRPRRVCLAAVALAAITASVLAGCSGDHGAHGSDASSASIEVPASADFSAADVVFARDMIPHHAQAVEMSDLALERSTDPQVRSLAAQIDATQGPEMAEMTGWLEQWGQPLPEASGAEGGHGGAHGGDHSAMPGMMSADQMQRLGEANGVAFDRMWLEMMIEHHEGAVVMAEAQLQAGQFPATATLARSIIATQTAEIAQMRELLAALPT